MYLAGLLLLLLLLQLPLEQQLLLLLLLLRTRDDGKMASAVGVQTSGTRLHVGRYRCLGEPMRHEVPCVPFCAHDDMACLHKSLRGTTNRRFCNAPPRHVVMRPK